MLQAATWTPRAATAKVSRNLAEIWNGLGFMPSSSQEMILNDATCKHESFQNVSLYFPYFKFFSKRIIVFIPCMEMTLILCLYFYLLCRRGNNHFDVHFRRIGPYSFLSKDGRNAVREGRNGWKGVYFPPESASFL